MAVELLLPPVVLDVTTVGLWTLDLQPEEGRITVIDRIFSFAGMICCEEGGGGRLGSWRFDGDLRTCEVS